MLDMRYSFFGPPALGLGEEAASFDEWGRATSTPQRFRARGGEVGRIGGTGRCVGRSTGFLCDLAFDIETAILEQLK